ncbi:MAG: hypothetical protein QOK37_1893 [Thermoanaerobaculia bacterium]|nr:hypothetical protein [Thermoanaerobaculia bacterium]
MRVKSFHAETRRRGAVFPASSASPRETLLTILISVAVALFSATAFAQNNAVAYSADFQSYTPQANAAGWIDTSSPATTHADHLFKTWPDPLQTNSSNVVYGVKPAGGEPRSGRFSTYTGATFTGRGHFEYRGRFLRTSSSGAVGMTFFASLPETLSAYVIGLKQEPFGAQTMQLFALGGGAPEGVIDSHFTPDGTHWTNFLIQADDIGGATNIRARFWTQGSPEPATFSIDAKDISASRLTSGRIGVWAGGNGDAFVDDLIATSAATERTSSSITFINARSHNTLDPARLALFKGTGALQVLVTGELSSATLDNAPFALGAPVPQSDGSLLYSPSAITIDGTHALAVHAGDADATLRFLVDQNPPVVALKANAALFADGTIFDRDVALTADITDISKTTSVVTLDNVTTSLPASVAGEAQHRVSVTVTDEVGWPTTVSESFVVDKTAPVVTITANGNPLTTGAIFNAPVTLGWTVEDLTYDAAQVTATLDGAPIAAGAIVSADAIHSVVVSATDSAHHTTSVTRGFTLDRKAPAAQLFANGTVFNDGSSFNVPVAFTVQTDAASSTVDVTVDGASYTPGTNVTEEKQGHLIKVVVMSATNNVTTLGPFHFTIDLTKPVIALTLSGQTVINGMIFNHDLQPLVSATDNFSPAPVRKLFIDGIEAPLNASITSENDDHTISASATDDAGNIATIGPLHFILDKTPPVITFTTPQNDAIVTPPLVTVQGSSGDAVILTVAGRTVVPNPDKTFTAANVTLAEGRNEIVGEGTDRAGNIGRATLVLNLDTRAPELTITAPAASSCLRSTQISVTGRTIDPHAGGVIVSLVPSSVAPVSAAVAADGTWTATIVAPAEGSYTIIAEGSDSVGHVNRVTLPVVIDSTPPSVQVTESGAAFNGGVANRSLTIAVRAADADTAASLTTTLNGQPFVSGTAITSDGDYTLTASARDCAGNNSNVRTITFTIDTHAPSIVSMAPADAASVGSAQQTISGTLDADDVASVVMTGTPYVASVSGRNFSFANVALAEGPNHFTLVATDRAGNSSTKAYALTSKSTIPIVDIIESGNAIAAGTLFNRAVVPVIRVSESGTTIAATLNSNPFTSGTAITADGSYTLRATAADGFGHTSAEATATFSVDTTPPVVRITSPANDAVIHANQADVRGTVSGGDIARFTVGGIVTTPAGDGSFSVSVPVESGINTITASAVDRAGNSGSDVVTVTRDAAAAGIILTIPVDNVITNRTTTPVAGQVLTPAIAANVTVNGNATPLDAAGVFRKDAVTLVEGDNTITASVVDKSGTTNSVSVHVPADFTPPHLRVLAGGEELKAGARFTAAPVIALDVSDAGGLSATSLTIDGVAVAAPFTPAANGGHALVAVARDVAGNETRVDRTFSIGDVVAGSGGCPPASFDPPDRSTIASDHVLLSGRAAAPNVRAGNALVAVADGAFATSVALPSEGANTISITCADAAGQALASPSTITLFRFTNAPSVTITSPVTDAEITTEKTQVAVSVGAGVTSGDINGIGFAITGDPSIPHTLTIDNVPIANGLNVITARVRNTAGRSGFHSVQVRRYAGDPQLSITSPLPSTQTGASAIAVSGNFANIDPATLAITAGGLSYPATIRQTSDTTGTFVVASVPLATAQTTTVNATARNRATGASVSASVEIQNVPGAPSITIASPADNSYFRSDAPKPAVNGTFSAAPAATVQVNGGVVPPSGSAFATTVDFAPGSTGLTPIVGRVANVDGSSATSAVRIVRLNAPLAVLDSYPAANAADVDPGVMILALFNNPLDKASIAIGTLRLIDSAGAEITGTTLIDRDALSFAPRVPLALGGSYTFTISQALKDVAGGSLAAPFVISFTTATTAPSSGPSITPLDVSDCLTSYTIRGTASAAGARLQLAMDGLTQQATAASDRSFSFTVDVSAPGVHVARVRELGADGTLSPETAVTIRVTCSSLQVVGASLDRIAKTVTIQFSHAVKLSSLTAAPTGTIQITPSGGSAISGTVALNAAGDTATVTTTADLSAPLVTLVVKKDVQDSTGGSLAGDYTQIFSASGDAPTEPGKGYVSGGAYDASTGRPLPNASVSIQSPAAAFSVPSPRVAAKSIANLQPAAQATGTSATNVSGRYARTLPEGAYTIEVSASGYTTAWRQVIVRAGAGVVPIDIRLTRRGTAQVVGSSALTLPANADSTITRAAELTIPAASALASHSVTLTPIGAQSLSGLLPLGWSPLASAEIAIDGSATPSPMPGAQLSFVLTAADIAALTASNQTLSLVEYDSDRDEWRTVVAVAPAVANSRLTFALTRSGNYALVYPDRGTGLAQPPAATSGAALQGIVSPCTGNCPITSRGFTLDPATIVPNGSTTATLRTDPAPAYPSGTAVQAYIDEQLNLADGRVILDPPFATDLLLYRSLTNDAGVAVFHLAPTSTAAAETLRDGVDHIRIVDYPGRVDRGTLIGAEGGRIPGASSVTLDIPAGATTQSLHATVTPFAANDIAAIGPIAGFHVAGGFTLSLIDPNAGATPGTAGVPPAVASLLKPARATFTLDATRFATTNRQAIVAELLSSTPFGAMLRLAAVTQPVTTDAPGVNVFTTRALSTAELPLDGIVRAGRYVILTADAPVAFAFGQVHAGDATAPALPNARVTSGIGKPLTTSLGVTDLTRPGGVFVVPVAATPAAQFALIARSNTTGDGDAILGTSVPASGAFVPFGVLPLVAQPLAAPAITPADGATISVDAPFGPRAVFAANIDTTSVANGITITNLTTGRAMTGTTTAAGSVVSFNTTEKLEPASSYALTVAATIRSLSGRLFGRVAVSHFSTLAVPASNTSIHPERIRITIPDANGVSTVSGAAGALPAGDQALAVRRGVAFINSPQATVNSDGGFQFTAGDGVRDILSTSDVIDLHVIDSVSHAIIAIIPLTPFVTADGTGFLAPVGVTTTFTAAAPLNVTITVPAGAFAVPTLVHLTASAPSDFAKVPSIDSELHLDGGVRVDFDGIAQVPLEMTIPAPSGASATTPYFLGMLGSSTRGARIEVVDTLRLAGGNFTTTLDPAATTGRISALNVHTQSTFATPGDVKKILARLTRPAAYTVIDMSIGVGWAVVSGAAEGSELFWDSIKSLFVSSYTLSRNVGRALIPVAADRPFTVTGVDASTGIQSSTKVYAGFAPGDPLGAVVLDPVNDNDTGPIPVFATPMRIENVEVPPEGIELTSVRGLKITYDSSGFATIAAGAPVPVAKTIVQVQNPARSASPPSVDISSAQIRIAAQPGDHLLITVAERDVDSDSTVSISFNKRMNFGGGSAESSLPQLSGLIKVFLDDEAQPSIQAAEVTDQVKFTTDSDAHRIILKFGGLQLGKRYKIIVSKNLTDASSTPLKLGQSRVNGQERGGLGSDLTLSFTVRAPGGLLATHTLLQGSVIHDMSLNGNLALVAAGDGGLQAFDISDPAKLQGSQPPLSAFIDCNWDGARQLFTPCGFGYWAVASDRHGRIITTGMSGAIGSLKTFRIRDFIEPTVLDVPALPRVAFDKQRGGTPISWTPGINSLMPIGSEILLGDKPEAIPRRVQILLQDDEVKLSRDALAQRFGGGSGTDLGGGYRKYALQISADRPAYQWQTITIENRTLKLRWSVDVRKDGVPSAMRGIIAGPNDDLDLVVNRTTYAVVSLFGFGVGVYDVNAIESNDRPVDSDYKKVAEIVALTNGNNADDSGDPLAVHQCDQAAQAASGLPCAINNLTYTPEALLRTGAVSATSSNIQLLALEQRHGIFDGTVIPPHAEDDRVVPGQIDPNSNGLSLTSLYPTTGGWAALDQPRLRTLRNMYQRIGGFNDKDIHPVPRHTGIAYYARPPTTSTRTATPTEYALIASFQYGVIVVKLGDTLVPDSVVDVIWIPAGAASVRVMPRGDMAVVVDGAGRVLLVDLRRIDESDKVQQPVRTCSNADCTDTLFPTVAASLSKRAPPLPSDADWTEVGVDDPRIIWKSAPHLVHGTLAPLVDPDTGIVFTGDVNATSQAEINAIAATDPRVRFMVNTGEQGGYRETGGLVPLGIEPPRGVSLNGPDASLAAFRVELWLPGSIAESLTNSNQELRLALESERIPNAATEQTIAPLPPSHLRHTDANGRTDTRITNDPLLTKFKMERLVPYTATDPEMKPIRYQEGFNHFVSPWVVAIADPRASVDYKLSDWTALSATDKAKLGCYSCNRPAFLDPATNPNVFELLTTGHFVSARPEVCVPGTNSCAPGNTIFTSTRYNYLGTANRLHGRVSTVMADTVRSTAVITAADAPPIAGGALQATTFLHSGEVMTSDVDLDAGGRAGWNVSFDRTYRSRTMLSSAIGFGWESSLFVRLRPLPNGHVEFRDGSGEVWLFKNSGTGYTAPVGLNLKLDATPNGWRIFDQKRRLTTFDQLGRIVSESDQFFDNAGGGNVINYFYDDHGRLGTVIDPVGRISKLTYYDDCANESPCFLGMLKEFADWRGRKVGFHYDAKGNLTSVDKPESKNSGPFAAYDHTGNKRPLVRYTYKQTSASFQDFIDLAADLESIREPADATPRVTFQYDGPSRDLVHTQTWNTPDRPSATFDLNVSSSLAIPSSATVVDTRGQKRTYTFFGSLPTNYNADRPHFQDVTEESVQTWSGSAFGAVPASVSKDNVNLAASGNRTTTFGYENGRLKTLSTAGGASTTLGYEEVSNGEIGRMLHTIDTAGGAGGSNQTINHAGDLAFVESVKADLTDTLLTPEARQGALAPSPTNAGVTRTSDHFASGLLHVMTSTGDGPGSKHRVEYYDAKDTNLFKRSMPSDVVAGNDEVKSHIDYPNADQSVEQAPRSVTNTTDYDEMGRPIHVRSEGKELSPEEWFAYDGSGRLVRHRHQQTSASGAKLVEERYEYDLADRTTKRSIFDGDTEIESTTTDYFVANANTITMRLPGGGTISNTIDSLGRSIRSETNPNHPNATPITRTTLYDREDNVAFVTDGKVASATAYDSAHRPRVTLTSEGTKTELTIDGWNRTRSATTTNGSATLGTYGANYEGPQLKHVDDNARKHDFAWDGAGRTKSAVLTGAEQPRASHIVFDTAGRLAESKFGQGDATSLVHTFTDTAFKFGSGNSDLPLTASATEDETHKQNWSFDHDTLGQPLHAGIDGSAFNFDHHFDESGNVTSSKTPERRGETTYDHDARSFTTAEHLPGTANPNKYDPDASGVLKTYTDPTGEPTKATNDGLGRPVLREYPDGTFEEIHYNGSRVETVRDRQGRFQRFNYDDGGRLFEVTSNGAVLDHIDYENGRVTRWRTPDASIEFSDFDVDNHPQLITQHRLTAEGGEVDTYSISHRWNAGGELVHTDMPSYQGMNAGSRWATTLDYQHDANSNVRTILRNGLPFMNAEFRSAGRPISRNLTLPNGATLSRAYDYDDANGSVGRLSGMRASVGSTLFAGSSITFEGLQRKNVQLLGISAGKRFINYGYDDRGRVTGSVVATIDPNALPQLGIPGASTVTLTDADFRPELNRTVAQRNDPPSTLTGQSTRGHKVVSITRGSSTEIVSYQGANGEGSVRTDDAKYHYEFDEKEHLRSITERLIPNGTQSRLIRVRFAFDGFGRIVGRRVEVAPVSNGQAPQDNQWTLATPDVVASQPLPAATTFVWDPVTDNLAAIFVEGASRSGTTLANGGLLRQFIHGGMGMDDPIEVMTPDARLYPIFDESGAGTLQAIIGENGQLVARGLTGDPYAEQQLTITAPALDEVKLTATKDSSGNLTQVQVMMHATEPLDPTTIASGTRLAALSATGAVVRVTTGTATQPDPYTTSWALSAADWTALTTNAAAISIAATSSLRSATYGADVPILPATDDMKANGNVFSTATLPIEVRESIGKINEQFAASGSDTPFALKTLTGLGVTNNASVASLILSPFQALPYVEAMTGQVNARERWYDPPTGSWLSTDPLGYQDSSNLYAFAGGDPVNGRDPSGLASKCPPLLINGSPNPAAIDCHATNAQQWLGDKIDQIQNRTVRAAANQLKELPDTVAFALYTRANPVVATVAGVNSFVQCHQQAVANRSVQAANSGQAVSGANLSLIGLNDCVGYNKLLRATVGYDPIAGHISREQQEREGGEFVGQTALAGLFGRLSTPSPAPTSLREPQPKFAGGAHGDLSTNGVQRNHMPADSVSPLPTARGPAMEMLTEDHMQTASWGSSRAAKAYRARQQQLIQEGRFFEAMQMDINDARVLFGTKYENAIREMLGYANTLDPAELSPNQSFVRSRGKRK